MLAVKIGARSAKRPDVADHVVDLRARQREIRHRTRADATGTREADRL